MRLTPRALLCAVRGRFKGTRAGVALAGSAWTLVGYAGTQLLRLASTLLLARTLLGPEAFGLVAMVNVALAGLEMMTDLGISTNVIQSRRGEEPDFVNTAFTLQAVRGLVLALAAVALAYPFARFYEHVELQPLVMVAGITALIRGVASPGLWLATRHVRLARVTVLTLAAEVAGFVVAVAWASTAPSAWALVGGALVNAGVLAIGSHFVTLHRSRFRWDQTAAREIMAFGAFMFLSSATFFLGGQAESLILGKFVPVALLGCFAVALMISTAASRGMTQVVAQVFFPMISTSYRADPASAAVHFGRVKWILLACASAVACVFMLLGPWIVSVLLPEEYGSAGWMLQLLGLRAAIDILGGPTWTMLFACGISKYSAIGNVLRLGWLAGGLAVALSLLGIREAIWVLTLCPLANYVVAIAGLWRHFRAVVFVDVATMAILHVVGGAALLAAGLLA